MIMLFHSSKPSHSQEIRISSPSKIPMCFIQNSSSVFFLCLHSEFKIQNSKFLLVPLSSFRIQNSKFKIPSCSFVFHSEFKIQNSEFKIVPLSSFKIQNSKFKIQNSLKFNIDNLCLR